MSEDDVKALATIAGTATAAGTGSITVATITAPAAGILGVVGFTTTTTVALPVAGIVVAGCLFGFGVGKGLGVFQ
ncbi:MULTISPECIES: hypothetical protein [unclassified Coleofasciculus]|uniref:hypothetical protein n=1 Tax=unclassified Coleofasciculus TaxID=2692782 RepID=UPI001882A558|nr:MULTISPECIES: hypothetical protein [unclassified Coleofasciculus]MBE9126504.1 hypothetical protein [Coleofasciculus sp. LEGE 07081]MBE9149899.1 hypothetical protein [Coleofasciculus sp. LEGE 07092]